MATALYRLSSGECLKVSPLNQTFAQRDPAIWGVLTDPALPDGSAVRQDNGDGTYGPWRVLGTSKIALPGTNTVRNATQPEIDTFATLEQADDDTQDVAAVVVWLTTHPQFRRVFKAILKRVAAENNTQAQMWNDFQIALAAAGNLAALKTAVGALGNLPIRTNAQAFAAILGDVSEGD